MIAAVVVAALVPGAAWATDHTDPDADTCKLYPGPGGPQSVQFCGADIATASDHLDSDGTAHIVVNRNAANCVGNGLDQASRPRFAIFTPAATAPTAADELGEISADFGTDNFFYRVGASKTALASLVQYHQQGVGMPVDGITYDISLPASLTATFGSTLKWMVGNACIGENPWDASDIAPDTGLYALPLGPGTPDTTKPTAPLSLHMTARGLNSITVAWAASTDNVGVTGYQVFLGATLKGNTTSRVASVSPLACGHSYALSVAARDAAGNVSPKTTITASTKSCVTGTSGNDTLPGTPANDVMHGNAGNDIMNGIGGNDTMYGDAGNDVLRGGPGNDRIYGGPGTDTIVGGPGTDSCYYSAGDHVSGCEHLIKK